MGKILDGLRRRPEIYSKLKKFYGNTIGLWWFKKWYIKNIGFYNGKKRIKLVSHPVADGIIAKKIRSGKPFMLARYGSTEFRTLFNKKDLSNLCFYSGFFPNKSRLWERFKEVYMDSSKQIDALVVWNYKNHFMKKRNLIRKFSNIEHFFPLSSAGSTTSSWLKELENKKILVIHPFKATIEHQYKKMDKLKKLPKLKKLEVIRAVQTIAGNKDERFETWFDALDYMKKEIDKKDFDIALIGCGAYGLPLAAYVKSIGKQAFHVGGGLQLYFGIKGKRWDNSKNVGYNKYWVYPMKEDFLRNCEKIEGGCYW